MDRDYLDATGKAVVIDGIKYAQGHLVPIANRNINFRDNLAVNLLSNIVPQSDPSNEGSWAGFENYTRSFVKGANNREVYVVAGTQGFKDVELPPKGDDPKRPVKIPEYLWKVILVLDRPGLEIGDVGENAYTIGLWMPNDNTPAKKSSWRTYVKSVDEIEDITGYDFFSNLPLNVQNSIEGNTQIRYPIDFTDFEDTDDLAEP